jgi:hypothetical protein
MAPGLGHRGLGDARSLKLRGPVHTAHGLVDEPVARSEREASASACGGRERAGAGRRTGAGAWDRGLGDARSLKLRGPGHTAHGLVDEPVARSERAASASARGARERAGAGRRNGAGAWAPRSRRRSLAEASRSGAHRARFGRRAGGKVGARRFSKRLRRKRSGRGPDVGLAPGRGHRGLGDARSLKLRDPGHTARGLVDEPVARSEREASASACGARERGPDVGMAPGLGHRGLGDARSLKLRGPGHTARGLVDEPVARSEREASASACGARERAGAGRWNSTAAWAPRPRRRSLAEASRSGAHRARFGGRAGGKVGARSFSKRLRRKGAGGAGRRNGPGLGHRGLGDARSLKLRDPGHTARGLVDEPVARSEREASASARGARERAGAGRRTGTGAWAPRSRRRSLAEASRSGAHRARFGGRAGGKVGARSFSKRLRRKGAGGAWRWNGAGAWAPRPRRRSLAEASRSGAHRARFGGRAGGKVGARSFSKRLRRKGAGGAGRRNGPGLGHRGLGDARSLKLRGPGHTARGLVDEPVARSERAASASACGARERGTDVGLVPGLGTAASATLAR